MRFARVQSANVGDDIARHDTLTAKAISGLVQFVRKSKDPMISRNLVGVNSAEEEGAEGFDEVTE